MSQRAALTGRDGRPGGRPEALRCLLDAAAPRLYRAVMDAVFTIEKLRKQKAARAGEKAIRLGLFGDPVAHSLSPKMQDAALEKCELPMRYAAFQIAPHELQEALALVRENDFIGINFTIPHKMAAAGLVDELDDFARRAGAINTVRLENGKLIGTNTDGPGFSRAIRSEFSVDLRDLRVLLLGASGGAGRAIAVQCATEGCERLVLVNRSAAKTQELAAQLKPFFSDTRVSAPVARLEAIAWDDRALRSQIANVDLVVNATSLGLQRTDPSPLAASVLAPHLMVYDTLYSRARSPLLTAAAEAGARGANGRSMLLHQGALSFETWFDRDAPLDVMRAALE